MKTFAVAAAASLFATQAFAMTYFFQEDLGVEGFQRYCRYSNGDVYTVNSTELCPMSIEEQGPSFSGGITGFKSGEYKDGMTKVCVYDVLGNERFLRVDSFELCPLSYEF